MLDLAAIPVSGDDVHDLELGRHHLGIDHVAVAVDLEIEDLVVVLLLAEGVPLVVGEVEPGGVAGGLGWIGFSPLGHRILAGAEDAGLVERGGAVGHEDRDLFFGELVALAQTVGAVIDGAAGDSVPAGAVDIGDAAEDDGAADAGKSDVAAQEAFELFTAVDVGQGGVEDVFVALARGEDFGRYGFVS